MSKCDLGFAAREVSRETLLEDLSELLDSDFNGDNGGEYTSKEALDNGFESDLEMAVHEAKIKFGENIRDIVEYVIDKDYNQDYYQEYAKKLFEIDKDNLLVALAYLS